MFSKICMSLSRSQRVNIFTDICWTDWFFSRSLHGIQHNFQKTKIFGSTSIIHISDVQVSDRYLINVGPGSLSSGLKLCTGHAWGRLSRRCVLLIMPWNSLLLHAPGRAPGYRYCEHRPHSRLVSRYSTVRSRTLTCREWGLWLRVSHTGHSDTKQC